MDSTTESEAVDVSEVRSGVSGEKRPVENGDLEGRVEKRARIDEEFGGDVKKVAELVLVLATMGKMRGGRSPTVVETEMMEVARMKLAEVCEVLAPKDLFPSNAFGAVIEDLGLSKLREQKLGFRPPKLTVAEKLLLTKQKMEKTEDFSLRSAAYSSQRLPTSGDAVENHTLRTFPSDKPNHAPIPSGGIQPNPSRGPVTAANSTSLPYQLPPSEVRPMLSSALPSSNLGRDSSSSALAKVDRPPFRLEEKSTGPSYTPQVQVPSMSAANSSGDHIMSKTPTWSVQQKAASAAKLRSDNRVQLRSDNKLPSHTSLKVEGGGNTSTSGTGPQTARGKQFVTQATSGNPQSTQQQLQGMKSVQTPLARGSHNDIGKIIQQFLQPKLPEHSTWTPPSRDYMNKALNCQTCKSTINEVENVLVCDACEKGFHLKCLQSHNQKGIPKGEWHCPKCLTLSNGKALPPKYGRVMRNMSAPKLSPVKPTTQSSSEEKIGTLDEKIHQQKITMNGSSGLPSIPTGTGNTRSHQEPGLETTNAKETLNDISSSRGSVDGLMPFETHPNKLEEISGTGCAYSSTGSSVDESLEEKVVAESTSEVSENMVIVKNTLGQSEIHGNPEVNGQAGLLENGENPLKSDNHLVGNVLEKPCGGETLNHNQNAKQVQSNNVTISRNSVGFAEQHGISSDGLHSVDWSDVLQVVGDKTYYHSCCINGIVYKCQDYALFRLQNDIAMPSKIQAMWEDEKTKSKWVVVSRCYFPSELPEAVGCPCSPESSEVYESNHEYKLMAGLIQGPCQVFPPSKFTEEHRRRNCSGTGADDGLQPLFLCKWFYDQPKGLFREVSS